MGFFIKISEKTLSEECQCYTGDHFIVYHLQLNHAVLVKSIAKIVSEYDQEILQSQTADNTVAP